MTTTEKKEERAFNLAQETGFSYVIQKFRALADKKNADIPKKIQKMAQSVEEDPKVLQTMYELYKKEGESYLRHQLERLASQRKKLN
ncbi:hypothetical protein GN244_ATG01684 [Phytophthora infestans]|uniref:Uncharacterized protein n=1 Tax=Phytophthora infestans TaxID=4787 RepID=A0A833TFP0_PHYIN|nr:hypothetical protein GN244_ATG01684 [Phytophthora infestans]KAF4133629.1 hypothetical protein GN958_ATG16966 [Phytophthora infestans]